MSPFIYFFVFFLFSRFLLFWSCACLSSNVPAFFPFSLCLVWFFRLFFLFWLFCQNCNSDWGRAKTCCLFCVWHWRAILYENSELFGDDVFLNTSFWVWNEHLQNKVWHVKRYKNRHFQGASAGHSQPSSFLSFSFWPWQHMCWEIIYGTAFREVQQKHLSQCCSRFKTRSLEPFCDYLCKVFIQPRTKHSTLGLG